MVFVVYRITKSKKVNDTPNLKCSWVSSSVMAQPRAYCRHGAAHVACGAHDGDLQVGWLDGGGEAEAAAGASALGASAGEGGRRRLHMRRRAGRESYYIRCSPPVPLQQHRRGA